MTPGYAANDGDTGADQPLALHRDIMMRQPLKCLSAAMKYSSRPPGEKVGDDSYPAEEIAAGVQGSGRGVSAAARAKGATDRRVAVRNARRVNTPRSR